MPAMTSAEATELANNARCIQSCIPEGHQLAALIYILQQAASNTETPEQLANSARCINSCIPEGAQMAVVAYLLNQMIPDA